MLQRFQSVLENGDRALGWTIARVPFDPAKAWRDMVRLRVSGEINGFPFRTSLFPEQGKTGSYYLLVNRAMQKGANVALGGKAAFTLKPDLEPRPADLPEELDALLNEAEGLRDWYGTLSEYTRRELGKWIVSVKGDEARIRRAAQAAERLLATMEAEAELPPLIEQAFQRRPKARTGWTSMTAEKRRTELMAVFYYQGPEARENASPNCATRRKSAPGDLAFSRYYGQSCVACSVSSSLPLRLLLHVSTRN